MSRSRRILVVGGVAGGASAAAKARYAALSEEGKAAIRERLVTARAANKEKKAEILKARAEANEED
jgi:hypothetical protein